jgi:hypothetical protein
MLKRSESEFVDLVKDITGAGLFLLGCVLIIVNDSPNYTLSTWGINAMMILIGYPSAISLFYRTCNNFDRSVKKYKGEL